MGSRQKSKSMQRESFIHSNEWVKIIEWVHNKGNYWDATEVQAQKKPPTIGCEVDKNSINYKNK